MNKLTIGFIILICIALVIFSYYSYKEEFNVSRTEPCSQLNESQCRNHDSCSIISDPNCDLKDEYKCSNIDPEVTNSSGDLACSNNGCLVRNAKTECDGLSSDCKSDKCFSYKSYDFEKNKEVNLCAHKDERYKEDGFTTLGFNLSTQNGKSYPYNCWTELNDNYNTKEEYNRYCLQYEYNDGYSKNTQHKTYKIDGCYVPKHGTDLKATINGIKNYNIEYKYNKGEDKCGTLTNENVLQCACYPIKMDENDWSYEFLPKGLFKGLSLDHAKAKISSIGCDVLNNIKEYAESLSDQELNNFNKSEEFTLDDSESELQTFVELVNHIIQEKCTVKSCNNICTNYDKDKCDQYSDTCSWNNTTEECKRKVEADCNSYNMNKCSNEDTCEYSSNYSFCGRKLVNCEPGQEIVVNENNVAECKNCKEGYFGTNGIRCDKCPLIDKDGEVFNPSINESEINFNSNYLRQISEPGATACVNRDSLCAENEYENIQIPTKAAKLLQQNYGYNPGNDGSNPGNDGSNPGNDGYNPINDGYNPGNDGSNPVNYSPGFDMNLFKHKLSNYKNSNRECNKLEKCDNKTQYATNFGENQIKMTSPTSGDDITLYFDQYNCSDLSVCDPTGYVSNFNMMESGKSYADGMYISNRICDPLTNCQEGEFVETTVQVQGDQNVSDRLCNECDINTYTDKPNMKQCVDQPLCELGQKVKSQFDDGNGGVVKIDRLECESCEDNTYQNTESRNFDCISQTPCERGFYFSEDNQERSKTYPVPCKECPCDEYQPDVTTFVNSCKNQPIVTMPGFGVTDHYPSCDNQDISFKSRSITIEQCDGDNTYQDNNQPHREKCKQHITCDRGELITSPDSTQTRMCQTIPSYEIDSCDDSRCKKKAKVTHRDPTPDYHPICTSGTLLQPFNNTKPVYSPEDLKKYDARCITPSERLAMCAKTDPNCSP